MTGYWISPRTGSISSQYSEMLQLLPFAGRWSLKLSFSSGWVIEMVSVSSSGKNCCGTAGTSATGGFPPGSFTRTTRRSTVFPARSSSSSSRTSAGVAMPCGTSSSFSRAMPEPHGCLYWSNQLYLTISPGCEAIFSLSFPFPGETSAIGSA